MTDNPNTVPPTAVLLVDDNPSVNFFHKIIIEEHDASVTVHTATDGRQALKALAKQRIFEGVRRSLILLDVHMPVMGGIEFVKEYAALPLHQRAEKLVILLTVPLTEEENEKLGPYGTLASSLEKPLTEEKLAGLLRWED